MVLLSDVDRSEVTLSRLAEDLALLNSLGVRLVLVQSTRHAIDAHADAHGHHSAYHNGRRITDTELLNNLGELVSDFRLQFRGLFMRAQHRNRGQSALVTGNFIAAKPLGVHEGVDHKFTGSVRRVDAQAIRAQLDLGVVVYLDHLAHSPAGQLYNLASEEVAAETAIALRTDKLILLGSTPACVALDGGPVSELALPHLPEIRALQTPELQRRLDAAERAIRGGVARSHVLDASADGAILTELMTTAGTGTMLTALPVAAIREARIDDLAGLLHLLAPLEAEGALVHRSRDKLEAEIGYFSVCEQDGRILGSAALYRLDQTSAELAALAVDPEKSKQAIGSRLLHHISGLAQSQGITTLFVLTTQAPDWFKERGFEAVTVDALPENRQALYNYQRNSLVLRKTL